MALWLFRRKSRRKRSRAGSPAGDASALPRSFTAPSGVAAAGPISSSPIRRRPSSRKQRPEPNKLQRRMRTYSFESGRADNLEIGGAGAWQSTGRRTTKRSATLPTHANATSNGGDLRDAALLDRIPTLHHSTSKRDGRHLLSRTKSSKRRKNAHDREREAQIKAMSSPNGANASNDFTPLRPAAEHWTAGRPMKRETMKTHPNSFAARYARGEKGKQPSDVSLPLAESIDSAMSSDSDQVAFVISPFAAFTPKPTLRYTSQPRIGPPGASSFPTRYGSQRRRLAMPIPEATLKAHKRVDDLANDMDASDLRELMERDARRRDRRRVHDEEKAARRLARQAERQTQLQQQQPSTSRPGPSASRTSPDMARGILGRETVGLGIGTTSAVMTSAVRRESLSQSPSPVQRNSIEFEERPSRDIDDPLQAPLGSHSTPSVANSAEDVEMTGANNGSASSPRRRASPVDMYHRPDSIPMEPAGYEVPAALSQADEIQVPKEPAPLPARTPSKLRRLARLRRRLSNTPSLREDYDSAGKANAMVVRKPSNSGSTRARGSLSWGAFGALFRWRARSKRPQGQSSFSNLSRDSMAAQSSIQRSQHQFEVAQQGQLRNPSQTLVEEPEIVTAAEAVVAGPSASTASVSSSTMPTQRPTKSHPFKATGLVPKRTLSRFREDLPDFLMSPPASRMQSPEVKPPLPAEPIVMAPVVQRDVYQSPPAQNANFINDGDDEDGDDESIILTPTAFHSAQPQHSSYDGTSMGNSLTNGTRDDTPTSWLQMEETDPSPEPPQSLSLASIDSEGSWLSGRTASRRRVTQMQPSLDSVSRSFRQQKHHHRHDQSWPSNELESTNTQRSLSPTETAHMNMATSGSAQAEEDESSIMIDDEYLSRLARSSTGGGSRADTKRESVGDMLPSSDDELDTVNGDGDARWGTVNEKRVEAVMAPPHRANLVKSREGLMKTFYDGEAGSDRADSPTSPVSPVSPVSMTSPISQASSEFKEEEAGVQRATSVNLGRGHARHISAGSAKLLEITPSPRNSVDAKAARPREPLF
ncbi:hypothetical protein SEUCBS140593_001854 [Sporothrix eucalyptigena]|uniref:Uncharacterized protein n=1 Tax=Sporothrix eucalyptigena TaxID=1812306 RepID=A0ABP0B1N4_9PEZI